MSDQIVVFSQTGIPSPEPTTKAHAKANVESEEHAIAGIGFQSNWGPTYSGSMIYDFSRNSIYLVGTTYVTNWDHLSDYGHYPRSSCFVGDIPLADIQQWTTYDDPLPPQAGENRGGEFVIPDSLEEREKMGCNSIFSGRDYLYVSGVDEPDSQAREGNIRAFLNVYQPQKDNLNWMLKMQPIEIHDSDVADKGKIPVRYPVAMVHGTDVMDSCKTEDGKKRSNCIEIVIVSASSDDNGLTDEFLRNDKRPGVYKNTLLPPGLGIGDPNNRHYYKRGDQFYLTYTKYNLQQGSKAPVFVDSGHVKPPSNNKYETNNIFPTGVAKLDLLPYIFVGHIQGSPPVQWKGVPPPVDADGNKRYDFDGFASVLGKSWGASVIFNSIESEDDFVHGVCVGPTPDEYYVVGSTRGTMPRGILQQDLNDENNAKKNEKGQLSAFVSKANWKSSEILWTTQLSASSDAEAFGCDVIPQEPTRMYVGGTVYNDGGMMPSAKPFHSKGADDVWVAQLDTTDGRLTWMKQIGSSGNDRISRTNGIQTDLYGDCVLYGDTTGALYRPRDRENKREYDGDGTEYHSDIFVMKLDINDGSYLSTVESDSMNIGSNSLRAIIAFIIIAVLVGCCYIICKWYRASRHGWRIREDGKEKAGADGLFSDGVLYFGRNNEKDKNGMEMNDNDQSQGCNGEVAPDNIPVNEVAHSDKVPPKEAFPDQPTTNPIV